MIRLTVTIWLAVVAGGGACSGGGTTEEVASEPGCDDRRPCPTPLTCEQRACVGDSFPDYAITLRILPQGGAALAPVELTDVRFTAPVQRLEAPVRIPNVVSLDGQVVDPDARSVPATRVMARPVNGIPTQSLEVEGAFSAVNPGIFNLRIAPWWPTTVGARSLTTYALRLALPDLPPWDAQLRWNQIEPRVVVEIPGTEAGARLAGVVRVSGSNALPLANVRVAAYADDTPTRQVSSEGLTDELGRFSINFWPAGAPRIVRLRLASTDPDRPLPVVERRVEVPAQGAAEPLELVVGDTGQLFAATITLRTPEGEPLTRATVRLEGEVGDGLFSARGVPDAEGRVRLDLYPGTYRIDVAPTLDGPTRLTRVERTLRPASAEALVTPAARTPVRGQVEDPAGQPVVGALVEAELTQAAYGDPQLTRPGEIPPRRVQRAETLADGSFLLALDPGTHALTITPTGGLPAIRTSISFSGDQPRTLGRLSLPAAAALVARLIDEQDDPVQGATVEAWVQDPPSRLAVARSDAEGRVRLALPAAPITAGD